MDTSIHHLKPRDQGLFRQLILVFEDVFEMEDFTLPPSSHLDRLLRLPDFMVFVALHESKVVGGLTVYILHQCYSEKPLAYVYDLAVQTTHQRKGIGRSLIATLNKHCQTQSFEEVFVQADAPDLYALDFYRSTQPTGEAAVVHFTYGL